MTNRDRQTKLTEQCHEFILKPYTLSVKHKYKFLQTNFINIWNNDSEVLLKSLNIYKSQYLNVQLSVKYLPNRPQE